MTFPDPSRTTGGARRQRGVATMIVVMVLFFVMSLVAAYTSRNIIFEQKTASNLHQGTLSFEAAEAGLEWALSLLNSGRIADDCTPTADTTAPTFRERYLTLDDPENGNIRVPAAVLTGTRRPVCVFTAGNWTCNCPRGDNATVVPGGGTTGFSPAFAVRFVQLGPPAAAAPIKPGMVRIEVNGCTQPDAACLAFQPADTVYCRGTVCAVLAVYGAARSSPIAPVTAKSSVNVGGAAMTLYNTNVASGGVTVLAGGAVTTGGMILRGPPGTPGSRTVRGNDPTLSAATFDADRMFASIFGVWRETYREQPAALVLDCSATCRATDIRTAVNLNPGRVILADGNVEFDDGLAIGSAAQPVALVVRGNLTFTGASTTTFWGLIYAETDNWVTSGAGTVRGAIVAQGQISGTGAYTVAYEPAVLDALRWITGSFVVVPGSWRDYP